MTPHSSTRDPSIEVKNDNARFWALASGTLKASDPVHCNDTKSFLSLCERMFWLHEKLNERDCNEFLTTSDRNFSVLIYFFLQYINKKVIRQQFRSAFKEQALKQELSPQRYRSRNNIGTTMYCRNTNKAARDQFCLGSNDKLQPNLGQNARYRFFSSLKKVKVHARLYRSTFWAGNQLTFHGIKATMTKCSQQWALSSYIATNCKFLCLLADSNSVVIM